MCRPSMVWPYLFVVAFSLLSKGSSGNGDDCKCYNVTKLSPTCSNECLVEEAAQQKCEKQEKCTVEPCCDGYYCKGEAVQLDLSEEEEIYLDAAKNDFFKFEVDLRSKIPDKTDVYLLAGASSTMTEAIKDIDKNLERLLEQVKSMDAHFGVGFYGDDINLSKKAFKSQLSLTEVGTKPGTKPETAPFSSALKSVLAEALKAQSDSQSQGSNLYALHSIYNDDRIRWRPGSRRIVLHVGDKPGHEPICLSDNREVKRETVVEELKGITVMSISVEGANKGINEAATKYDCGNVKDGGSGQALHIANNSGGMYVAVQHVSSVTSQMIEALKNRPRQYIEHRGCEALKVDSKHLGPSKMGVTLEVMPEICDGREVECSIEYKEGGAVVGKTVVRAFNVKDCEEG